MCVLRPKAGKNQRFRRYSHPDAKTPAQEFPTRRKNKHNSRTRRAPDLRRCRMARPPATGDFRSRARRAGVGWRFAPCAVAQGATAPRRKPAPIPDKQHDNHTRNLAEARSDQSPRVPSTPRHKTQNPSTSFVRVGHNLVESSVGILKNYGYWLAPSLPAVSPRQKPSSINTGSVATLIFQLPVRFPRHRMARNSIGLLKRCLQLLF